jgi:hypothetical protein
VDSQLGLQSRLQERALPVVAYHHLAGAIDLTKNKYDKCDKYERNRYLDNNEKSTLL